MTTTTEAIAWLAINDETDADGFFLEGDAACEAERRALREEGAPDTDAIAFLSMQPEDRDSAMAEARVTPALAAWLRANAVAYDE